MYRGFSRGCKVLLAYSFAEKWEDAPVADVLEPAPLGQLAACGLVRVVRGRLRATSTGRTVFKAFVAMGDEICVSLVEVRLGARPLPIGPAPVLDD